jgi:hypothetical protein
MAPRRWPPVKVDAIDRVFYGLVGRPIERVWVKDRIEFVVVEAGNEHGSQPVIYIRRPGIDTPLKLYLDEARDLNDCLSELIEVHSER